MKKGGAPPARPPVRIKYLFVVLRTVFLHTNYFFHPPIGRNYPRRTQYTEHPGHQKGGTLAALFHVIFSENLPRSGSQSAPVPSTAAAAVHSL